MAIYLCSLEGIFILFFPPFEKSFFVLSNLLINSVICFPWIKIEIEVQLMDSFYNPVLSQQSMLKLERTINAKIRECFG